MGQLALAHFKEVATGGGGLGGDLPVQFNPTSLKVNTTRKVTGLKSDSHQNSQDPGVTDSTLSVDLIFDTAEEGTTNSAVSVVPRVKQLLALMEAAKNKTKGDNRKTVAFIFGDFRFDGYVGSMNVDYDLFSAEGFPLHAKVSVSMTSQAPTPNQGAEGGDGRAGLRIGVALGGESLAGFSARMGLDPSGWRGLAGGISNPLSLSAGLEINLGGVLQGEGGLGITAGLEVNLGTAPEFLLGLNAARGHIGGGIGGSLGGGAALGGALAASPGVAPGAGASGLAAQANLGGRALAGAGGLRSALDALAEVRVTAAAGTARRSFVTPPAAGAAAGAAASAGFREPVPTSAPLRPARRDPDRTPLGRTAGTRLPEPRPLEPPVQIDRRAATYGQGVPLRPRILATPPPARPLTPSRSTATSASSRTGGGCGCGGTCGGCGGNG